MEDRSVLLGHNISRHLLAYYFLLNSIPTKQGCRLTWHTYHSYMQVQSNLPKLDQNIFIGRHLSCTHERRWPLTNVPLISISSEESYSAVELVYSFLGLLSRLLNHKYICRHPFGLQYYRQPLTTDQPAFYWLQEYWLLYWRTGVDALHCTVLLYTRSFDTQSHPSYKLWSVSLYSPTLLIITF